MPEIFAYSANEVDIATDAAMETLLWQAGEIHDEAGNSTGTTWDAEYDVDDFVPEARVKMREFLDAFMNDENDVNLTDLVSTGHVAGWGNDTRKIAQIGHDYVLTTGGHGAGFWDRGHGEAGERLSEVCRAERHEWGLWVDADGKLHCHDLEG